MRVGGLGAPELILIVVALVLVFGAGKLGDIGGALGKSVKEFKKAQAEEPGAASSTASEVSNGAPVAPLAPAMPPPTVVTDYRPAGPTASVPAPPAAERGPAAEHRPDGAARAG